MKVLVFFIIFGFALSLSEDNYHVLIVIDSETKRGVPMVNLSTTNLIPHHTDSNGFISFYEPGMMDQEVWFQVEAEGYEIKPWTQMFPYRGTKVTTTSGKNTTLEVDRLNIAERLYRTTGQGVYEDTYLAGKEISYPNNNQNVVGQDTVFSVQYKGKLYWFWGDTSRTSFPLGNFYTTGATTPIAIDLEEHPPYTYFAEGDFVKSLAPFFMNDSSPVWVSQVVVLENQMFTQFYKACSDGYYGYAKWNDDDEIFDFIRLVDTSTEFIIPSGFGEGQPFENTKDPSDEYLYFGNPYVNVRIPKNKSSSCYYDISCYESYTPLKEGTGAWNFPDDIEFDYTGHLWDKKLKYGWKKNTGVLTADNMNELVGDKKMDKDEAIYLQLQGIDTGEDVIAHSGSMSWNEYLGKYVFVVEQIWGKESFIGEIWVSTSDDFLGPFKYAQKVVSHNHHDFYNIKEHYLYAKNNYIYFEGKYVNTFDDGINVPKYNYNNQMYRLNLDKLKLPDAIYYHKGMNKVYSYLEKDLIIDIEEEVILFYAYTQPVEDFNVGVCRKTLDNTFTTDCLGENLVLFYGTRGGRMNVYKDHLISVVKDEMNGDVFVLKK